MLGVISTLFCLKLEEPGSNKFLGPLEKEEKQSEIYKDQFEYLWLLIPE